MNQRYQPIPLVQAGGIQPYHGSTPQIPGAALSAMLAGRTASGFNPMDVTRAVQKKSGQQQLSGLLAMLAR